MGKKNYYFPRTLMLAAALAAAGAAGAQEAFVPEALIFTFERAGSTSSDVTVYLSDADGAGVDGAEATITVDPDTLKTSGSDVGNNVVCPDVNGYANGTYTTMTFTLAVTGLPAGFAFDTAEANLRALRQDGTYQIMTNRSWTITLLHGSDEASLATFGTGTFDLAQTPGIPYTAQFSGEATEATAEGGTLYVRLTASLNGTNGCFIGLESLTLHGTETAGGDDGGDGEDGDGDGGDESGDGDGDGDEDGGGGGEGGGAGGGSGEDGGGSDEASHVWYRIQNYQRKASTGNTSSVGNGGYLEVTDKVATSYTPALMAMDADDSRALALWEFQPGTADGQYYLYNVNSGLYIGTAVGSGNFAVTASDKASAEQFTVTTDASTGRSLIVSVSNSLQLHASGNGNEGAGLQFYNSSDTYNSASAWYITEATGLSLEIGSTGWAAVNYPFAVELDEGLTAYTATGVSEDVTSVLLKEVGMTTLPANTPVLLYGRRDTYELPFSVSADGGQADGEEETTSVLRGTTMAELPASGVNAYALGMSYETADVGFMLVGDMADCIPANSAYYVYDGLDAPSYLVLDFDDTDDGGGDTGDGDSDGGEDGDGDGDGDGEDGDGDDIVVGVGSVTAGAGGQAYYDLQGRRVLYPSRGIYVTAAGKKVFIK